jgi:hypothetical protein
MYNNSWNIRDRSKTSRNASNFVRDMQMETSFNNQLKQQVTCIETKNLNAESKKLRFPGRTSVNQ